MFSTGLSLLTATSMLIHSIVGCCWHSGHDHTCDHTAACETAAVETVEHGHETSCDHDHEADTEHHSDDDGHQHDDEPCHPDGCSEHSCVSMLTPSVSTDLLIATVMAWSTQVVSVDDVAFAGSLNLAATRRADGLPVPDVQHRCALSQSWLL